LSYIGEFWDEPELPDERLVQPVAAMSAIHTARRAMTL
jgi:hypothetical protein